MNATIKNSRKTSLQIMVVVFLGWLLLLLWSVVQWFRVGYEHSQEHMNSLLRQQKQVVTPVFQGSLLGLLPINNQVPAFKIKQLLIPAKSPIQIIAADFVKKTQQLIVLAKLSVQCMIFKLFILIASIPLFAVAVFTGLIDGLSQRAVRTACLGRESSYLFHQLNRRLKQGLLLLLTLWLALPLSINPALVFVPTSIALSFMVAVTASRFKKYL